MQDESPINIVESLFAYLSPFSAHQVHVWGETFATVEHAYQSARLVPGSEREEVKNAPSPLAAWKLGVKYKRDPNVRNPVFDKDAVMEELCRAKLAQHSDIAEILKESGQRGLLKIYHSDYYWGTGADGSGENQLGKLWMKLRSELSQ